jgi:phage protein D
MQDSVARLARQIEFIVEVDRLKEVFARRSTLRAAARRTMPSIPGTFVSA